MKKALIDPSAIVWYVSGWQLSPFSGPKYEPVLSEIENSARVAQVEDLDFPVAPPLFWVDCADDVVADLWYFDTTTAQIVLTPEPPPIPS